jgi:hypothetical protein
VRKRLRLRWRYRQLLARIDGPGHDEIAWCLLGLVGYRKKYRLWAVN